MNIEELETLKELSEQTYFGDLLFVYYADLIGKLLTAYEKEKEIIKNAICFLKYYNKDFDEMNDNEIKQILYNFGKCADIKKEE